VSTLTDQFGAISTGAFAGVLSLGYVWPIATAAVVAVLLVRAVRRASESPPRTSGVKAAQWSFVLAVPAWTLVALTRLLPPHGSTPGYLAITAALALLPAGVLSLVGVGVAVLPSNLRARDRWTAGALSLPALVAIAIGFYVFATWNPGE
jgi:hypothetical protein